MAEFCSRLSEPPEMSTWPRLVSKTPTWSHLVAPADATLKAPDEIWRAPVLPAPAYPRITSLAELTTPPFTIVVPETVFWLLLPRATVREERFAVPPLTVNNPDALKLPPFVSEVPTRTSLAVVKTPPVSAIVADVVRNPIAIGLAVVTLSVPLPPRVSDELFASVFTASEPPPSMTVDGIATVAVPVVNASDPESVANVPDQTWSTDPAIVTAVPLALPSVPPVTVIGPAVTESFAARLSRPPVSLAPPAPRADATLALSVPPDTVTVPVVVTVAASTVSVPPVSDTLPLPRAAGLEAVTAPAVIVLPPPKELLVEIASPPVPLLTRNPDAMPEPSVDAIVKFRVAFANVIDVGETLPPRIDTFVVVGAVTVPLTFTVSRNSTISAAQKSAGEWSPASAQLGEVTGEPVAAVVHTPPLRPLHTRLSPLTTTARLLPLSTSEPAVCRLVSPVSVPRVKSEGEPARLPNEIRALVPVAQRLLVAFSVT